MRNAISLLAVSATLAGCALPASGPNSAVVEAGASAAQDADALGAQYGYEVIDVDAVSAAVLMRSHVASLAGSFGTAPPPPRKRIGVGDVLQVSIFEKSAGGLFSPPVNSITTGSRQAVLPNQVVAQDGYIDVPYGGRIRASGLTPSDLARQIEQALDAEAIAPQVIVTLMENGSYHAAVLGEVTQGGKIPLSVRGDRLLTVIAAAGGVRGPEHESMVRVVRGGRVQTVPLRTIVNAPSENIYIYPDDTVYLLRQTMTFTAFGAVSSQGQIVMDRPEMRLSDALAKAGGLSDSRADQGGIFLFRYESRATVAKLRGLAPVASAGSQLVPVVYRIQFSDPRSFHWIQGISVRDGDVIYVANAPTVEISKFFSILGQVVGLGLRTAGAANAL